MSGKVKDLRSGAEAKASVKSTVESLIIDPKPGDLSMQAEVTAKTGDAKEGKVEIPEKKKTDDEPHFVLCVCFRWSYYSTTKTELQAFFENSFKYFLL